MRILLFLLLLSPVFASAQILRAYGVIEVGSLPTSSATGPKFAYRPADSSFYRWVSGSTWVKIIPDEPDTLYLKQLSGTTALVDGDTIDISTYFLKSDTTSAFASYLKRPVGWGLSLLTGKYPFVDSSKVASRYYVSTNPTTIAANYAAVSNGTNLIARNLFDNNTYAGVIGRPWKFGEYTTAALPTGVTGYTVYSTTTNGPAWYQGSRWAYGLESTFNRGTAANIPYFDANGQITQNSGFLFTGTFHRVRINSSNFVGFQVINDGTGSNSVAGFEVVNGAGGFMDVGISSSTGTGFIGASSGFYAAPPNGIAFNTQTIGSNFRFGFNGTERVRITNSGLFVGQTTGTESVDISDDLRVRDSTRLGITPAHTSITGLLTRDANGWAGLASISGGLSYSGGGLSSTWLGTALPTGDVQINAANNSLRLNSLDTAKFNNAIITSVGTNLLLMNPNVGSTGIDDFGGGFHTNINGTIESNPGYANIVIGGVIESGPDQFRMAIGYQSNVSGIGSIGLGYDADATGIAAMAIGLAAEADENYEISLGSNEYKKLNLWAGQSGGSIVAINYGTGVKEASDLSKTQSAYIAGFATDGTLLDYPISGLGNGIYSGSATLANHTTRARVPDDGNLLFSQIYNTTDSAYIQFVNNLDGNREIRGGLTDTASTGFSKFRFYQDEPNEEMGWEILTSDGTGTTTARGQGGNLSLYADAAGSLEMRGAEIRLNNGEVLMNQYGQDNMKASDLGQTSSNFVAGYSTTGRVVDFQIRRDTFTEDASVTITNTSLGDCSELFITTSMTNLAAAHLVVSLPSPSASNHNKRVSVWNRRKDVGLFVPVIDVTGGGSTLYYTANTATTAPSDQATLTLDGTTWHHFGKTYVFNCVKINSTNYRWVLTQ